MERIQGSEERELVATTDIPTLLKDICELVKDHRLLVSILSLGWIATGLRSMPSTLCVGKTSAI